MITIPNLPTDNIYKFIFLSGVLFVILYFIGMIYSDSYLYEKNINNLKQTKYVNIELKKYNTHLEELLSEKRVISNYCDYKLYKHKGKQKDLLLFYEYLNKNNNNKLITDSSIYTFLLELKLFNVIDNREMNIIRIWENKLSEINEYDSKIEKLVADSDYLNSQRINLEKLKTLIFDKTDILLILGLISIFISFLGWIIYQVKKDIFFDLRIVELKEKLKKENIDVDSSLKEVYKIFRFKKKSKITSKNF